MRVIGLTNFYTVALCLSLQPQIYSSLPFIHSSLFIYLQSNKNSDPYPCTLIPLHLLTHSCRIIPSYLYPFHDQFSILVPTLNHFLPFTQPHSHPFAGPSLHSFHQSPSLTLPHSFHSYTQFIFLFVPAFILSLYATHSSSVTSSHPSSDPSRHSCHQSPSLTLPYSSHSYTHLSSYPSYNNSITFTHSFS